MIRLLLKELVEGEHIGMIPGSTGELREATVTIKQTGAGMYLLEIGDLRSVTKVTVEVEKRPKKVPKNFEVQKGVKKAIEKGLLTPDMKYGRGISWKSVVNYSKTFDLKVSENLQDVLAEKLAYLEHENE